MLCQYGCGREGIYQLKSGKMCCNEIYQRCPSLRKKNSERQFQMYKNGTKSNGQYKKVPCEFCKKEKTSSNISKHSETCYLNPKNLKLCPICEKPIKYYTLTETCSNRCARRFFNKNYEEDNGKYKYREVCFQFHEKKCIICEENLIVDVHHLDENKQNINPENLIPLCPTHHKYIHCKFKEVIIEKVEKYEKEFLEKFSHYNLDGKMVDL